MWDAGAKFYTCSTNKVVREIGKAAKKLVAERSNAKSLKMSDEAAET